MKRHPWFIIAVAVIVVATAEICFHWLVGRDLWPTLAAVYLPSNYTHSRDDFAGLVDTLIPAAILGLVSGWVAFRDWSLRKLTLATIGFALFVAAMEPFYWAIIGWRHFYGVHEPKNLLDAVTLFPLLSFVTAFAVCLFFANLAYRGRKELNKSGS